MVQHPAHPSPAPLSPTPPRWASAPRPTWRRLSRRASRRRSRDGRQSSGVGPCPSSGLAARALSRPRNGHTERWSRGPWQSRIELVPPPSCRRRRETCPPACAPSPCHPWDCVSDLRQARTDAYLDRETRHVLVTHGAGAHTLSPQKGQPAASAEGA